MLPLVVIFVYVMPFLICSSIQVSDFFVHNHTVCLPVCVLGLEEVCENEIHLYMTENIHYIHTMLICLTEQSKNIFSPLQLGVDFYRSH